MYWPALQLTTQEAKRYALYSEPNKAQKAVSYRVYAGELTVSPSNTEDTENIQISRRSRVFALTASGDVHNFEVELFDSVGERYTMGFVPCSALFPGTAADPRGWFSTSPEHAAATAITPGSYVGVGNGAGQTLGPHVFEPNLLLLANQTLSIKGRALVPPRQHNGASTFESFKLSFCLHVWEFPIE